MSRQKPKKCAYNLFNAKYKGENKMAQQDTENLTRELKGESTLAPRYARGKANATINDLAPAHQVRKAPYFQEVTFTLDTDAKYGCIPVTGLVTLGLLTILEAHKMGFTKRI